MIYKLSGLIHTVKSKTLDQTRLFRINISCWLGEGEGATGLSTSGQALASHLSTLVTR